MVKIAIGRGDTWGEGGNGEGVIIKQVGPVRMIGRWETRPKGTSGAKSQVQCFCRCTHFAGGGTNGAVILRDFRGGKTTLIPCVSRRRGELGSPTSQRAAGVQNVIPMQEGRKKMKRNKNIVVMNKRESRRFKVRKVRNEPSPWTKRRRKKEGFGGRKQFDKSVVMMFNRTVRGREFLGAPATKTKWWF